MKSSILHKEKTESLVTLPNSVTLCVSGWVTANYKRNGDVLYYHENGWRVALNLVLPKRSSMAAGGDVTLATFHESECNKGDVGQLLRYLGVADGDIWETSESVISEIRRVRANALEDAAAFTKAKREKEEKRKANGAMAGNY